MLVSIFLISFVMHPVLGVLAAENLELCSIRRAGGCGDFIISHPYRYPVHLRYTRWQHLRHDAGRSTAVILISVPDQLVFLRPCSVGAELLRTAAKSQGKQCASIVYNKEKQQPQLHYREVGHPCTPERRRCVFLTINERLDEEGC